MEVLEKRLRGRNTETEESLKKRLSVAKEELDYGKWIFVATGIWPLLFKQKA
jgi:guanylate kinase